MEFSLMLQRLWRLRVAVGIGVLVAAVAALSTIASVSLSPFHIEAKRGGEFGAAETTVYVDTARGSVARTQGDTAGLVARTQIYARFINSGGVRERAARQLGVPPTAIAVSGPNPDQPGQQSVQPAAQQRANALLSPASPYSVFVDTELTSPTITLFTQARTGPEALRLATAITDALADEVHDAQQIERPDLVAAMRDELRITAQKEDRTISAAERRQARRQLFAGETVVRTLGDPVGGSVTDQTDRAIALVVFVAVVLVWCVGLLLISGAVSAIRRRPAHVSR